MEYKYIISDFVNPYENLALEQSLFRLASQENVILFLWQNDNTIVVGRNQNVHMECRADEFLLKGGRIARRHSGGGAVYHDLGNLNYSIISRDVAPEAVDYRTLATAALAEFGITVRSNGRNDLMAQGRKISGSAIYHDGEVRCCHATILVNVDIEKMTYYLTPNQSKLDRNHVSSVASRVMNLSETVEGITVDRMRSALIRAANAVPFPHCPDRDELRRLTEFFESAHWIFGADEQSARDPDEAKGR